ncbi:MAG TPA: c-type cytochrome [Vicinamibacterales bacterium]|nr:c-type cytochrome [Vicinamibacterales bacterium]
MKRNKHLLLWSSVVTLGLLVVAAAQENLFKDWRRLQQQASGPDGGIEVRLRQVVVPALGVIDRCITCHVGMAPGESSVLNHPVLKPHPPVPHDPAEFGCTTCHGGQGRATELADAHGDVHFWPEPMLRGDESYAGCGSCHTHLAVPRLTDLRHGLSALERADCMSCHRLDGRGGTLRPDGGGMEGPDLSLVAASGFRADWYDDHLAQRARATAGPWRTSVRDLSVADRDALDVLLKTRVGAPRLVESKALFQSLGCRGCHQVNGVGGDDGPDLSREGLLDPGRLDYTHVPGSRTVQAWLAEHFREPARVVPGSLMPLLGLTEPEIDLLTFYMLSLRPGDRPEAFWPADRIRALRFGEREFRTDGESLYAGFCAACHGPQGEGRRYAGIPPFPAIANRDFLSIASDDFIRETVRRGRPGRRMPAWATAAGLRPAEIDAVVSHVRTLGGVVVEPDRRPARWVTGDAAEGERLFARACESCHGSGGRGGEGPALANPVLLETATDTYLVETIGRGRRGTSMEGFRTPSPTRPTLVDAEIEAIVAYLRRAQGGS